MSGDNEHKPKISSGTIVGCIVLLALFLFGVRAFTAFPLKKLDKVKPGMTMQEVEELVGRPTKTDGWAGHTYWDYDKPLAFGYGGVHFTNGIVESTAYEQF